MSKDNFVGVCSLKAVGVRNPTQVGSHEASTSTH